MLRLRVLLWTQITRDATQAREGLVIRQRVAMLASEPATAACGLIEVARIGLVGDSNRDSVLQSKNLNRNYWVKKGGRHGGR